MPTVFCVRNGLRWAVAAAVAIALQVACNRTPAPAERTDDARAAKKATVVKTSFGHTADGTPVDLFTLSNAGGMEVRTMPYGAIIVSIRVPDRSGQVADVVLGFDTFDEYVAKKPPYFGAVVGRYGNRIAKGRFV